MKNLRAMFGVVALALALAACGNAGGGTGQTPGVGDAAAGIPQAAEGDYDGMIRELTAINKRLAELMPKVNAGDIAASSEVSDLGVRSLTIQAALIEASTSGKLSQVQMDAWAQANAAGSQ